MDILRRNTDHALRLMVGLAQRHDHTPISTRALAKGQDVPYQLACKLMQRLGDARLVSSCMGPKGGFRLNRSPAQIGLLEIVEVIQGPVRLNRCLMSETACPRGGDCPIRRKIAELQGRMEEYLGRVTLGDLVDGHQSQRKPGRSQRRSR
ncbi:MAG: Rrf2 family transcriptional regulator [Sedimentisphaerales bacterium]|nr:Rrf2 family transcriptional regulator [Sedimentisphaerales bacterium]